VPLTQYYTASSLDGFIADPDNSLEWLFSRARDDAGALSYGRFIAEVGALAMGATTYEWLLEHEVYKMDPDGVWPYEIPCWVFTHRRLPIVAGAPVELTRDPVGSVHERLLEAAGGRNVWLVGGGDLVGQFADLGLLDEILVTFAPVTLGAGAPLLPRRLELRLEETGRNGDFVGARYSVVRE
jgi:dihydrofolate reductase